MFLILCIIDLVVLFFLSRLITSALSLLIHTKTRRLSHTIKIFSFLLLPGTFLHELAHYVIAHVLGVRTYDFVLMPKLEEDTVHLGSVSVAKSDIFRRTVIGIAPLMLGLGSIFFGMWWIALQPTYVLWQVVLLGFVTFQISNTMFPSKADIEGTAPLFVVLLCGGIAVFLLVGNSVASVYSFGSSEYLKTALFYFSVIIAIDIGAFSLLRILLYKK